MAKTICCLVIAGVAAKYAEAGSSVQERYFKNSWTRVSGFTTNAPMSPQAVPVGDPSFKTSYAKPTHISITRAAYKTYASHFDGTEFAHYLPRIIAGSYEEDAPYKNPFGQLIPELRHFWDCREGSGKGLAGYDSAVDRAYKYFSGGYGVHGDYDPRWSEKGVKGSSLSTKRDIKRKPIIILAMPPICSKTSRSRPMRFCVRICTGFPGATPMRPI